jgi:hypothetical protein
LAFRSPERLNQLVADVLVALAMIVGDELGNRASKMSLPNGITRARHFSLIERTNRSHTRCNLVLGTASE